MGAERFVLAIDDGSTGVRALVIDREGEVCGHAHRETEASYPVAGRVEQDAAAIWSSTVEVVGEAMRTAGANGPDLAAIGVTGQRSTAVAWSRRAGAPLHRAIGWQDLRGADRSADLLGEGHIVPAQAAATKFEWLVKNVEAVRGAHRTGDLLLGTVESFLVWKLTGGRTHATDVSFASATGLFDLLGGSGDWNDSLLETLGLSRDLLPEIRSSSEVYGSSDPAVIGAEVPVAGLAGDQQAAMFGQCRFRPGEAKASYGTSTMIDLNVGSELVLSERGAWPMILWKLGEETSFLLEGSLLTAGAAIRWLRDGLGVLDAPAESEALARSVSDTGGVWVVPAWQGLGTPYQDAEARAAIGGVSLATTKAHLVRAVLEGIALRVAEIVESLAGDSPAGMPDVLRVDGGMAANDFLLQFQADVLGIPVERPEAVEAAAMGAAFLAGRAVGLWPGTDALERVWRPGRRFEPTLAGREREDRLGRFRRIVEATRVIG